ncbi:MAG: hypothetical protein GXC78_11060 [Chitinophagaceae bacterium]|jgi:hypothetical protein|nr:hypothetical protein [Chitinophagaceae bacterium]
MTEEEFQASRKFTENKLLELMEHEVKPHAAVAWPAQSYLEYNKNSRKFFYFGTNIFRGFFEENIANAIKLFPKNFGNGNAMSVIHAINKVRPLYVRTKEVIRLLKTECFAVVHEDRLTAKNDDIIRLDLFRKLDKQPHHKRKYDFTGGIMHALKHFTLNGNPLSTGTDINDISPPLRIVEIIIDTFFIAPDSYYESKNKYVCFYDLDPVNDIKFVFYYEDNSGVFFLDNYSQANEKRYTKG